MNLSPCCKVYLAAGKKYNMMDISFIRSVVLKGRIFKVLPDPFLEVWFVECRDPEGRQAYIYRIPDGMQGNISPLPLSFDWSKTLLSVGAGEVVIGQYEAGGMPVISGIEAWDSNGIQLWCYPSAKKVTQNPEGWTIFSRDQVWTESFRMDQIPNSIPLLSPALIASVPAMPDSEMKAALPDTCLPQGEFLTTDDFKILSYFTREKDSEMTQWLMVSHRHRGVMVKQKIQSQLKGYSLDLWSVRNNKLFYISGYQTWNCLDLKLEGELPA
jgi:hypothetical protein